VWHGSPVVGRPCDFHTALAEIFRDPQDPILLIKWKEILENAEDATDRIELVAKLVSSTVMKNA